MNVLKCSLLLLALIISVSTVTSTNLYKSNYTNTTLHASKPKEVHYCLETQYLCKGGKACIDRKFICDGLSDCPDGDDENGCNKHRNCEPGFYQCKHTSNCIPLFLVPP
ncbi:prolow density lipoprotein receptor-like protein [Leptotrombidium deliense]|uniref:Prolow density lipoprotein receptor-like protein n=1 Tax=Leptotrombidium deliense TaxID=299467 RepID=A0A443S652_9ACAR|nr:prolow density lipoprotein receptor-like protein [Leptotrombidium deliense]